MSEQPDSLPEGEKGIPPNFKLRIPLEMEQQLTEMAEAEGKTLQELINKILTDAAREGERIGVENLVWAWILKENAKTSGHTPNLGWQGGNGNFSEHPLV